MVLLELSTEREWPIGKEWASAEGLRFRIVAGDKDSWANPDFVDHLTQVWVNGRWVKYRMMTTATLAAVIGENEEARYPQSMGFNGKWEHLHQIVNATVGSGVRSEADYMQIQRMLARWKDEG